MDKSPRRLRCETVSFVIGEGNDHPGHRVSVNLGYSEDDRVIEIAFCEAGKIGQGVHLLLSDLGIKLSRAPQNRNPQSGEPEA